MLSFALTQLVDAVAGSVSTHPDALAALSKSIAYASGSIAGAYAAWTKGLRPAYRASRDFVLRANSALALVEHELNPNGGGSLRDIVNATRSEVVALGRAQALSTAMQRSQAVASRSPMFQTDAQGLCQWVNDTWQRATGIGLEEAMGRGGVNGVHPDDRERVMIEWQHAVADVRTFRCDYRYRHVGTGEVTPVRTEAHPIRTPDGLVAGYVGTVVLLDAVGLEPFSAYDRRRYVLPPLSSLAPRTL